MWNKLKSFFSTKKKSETESHLDSGLENQLYPEPSIIESGSMEDLKRELKEALRLKEDAIFSREKLEKQISKLENQLQQKEIELSNLNSAFNELSSVPADSKEETIIDLLKKDLHKKDKELESKKEEIEDLEDEISSIQRKLKTAKNEASELTQKVESFDKKIKKYEADLKDLDSELTELKEENKIKSKAIEFVNSVLQAKDADERDAREINEKVNQIKSIITDQYIPLQKQYFNNADHNIDEWIKKALLITDYWANLQRKSWIKRKKVIAFIGEFSAGKTSIVNRILSQDDPDCPRLPVSSKATTAIATYISYGEGFYSQFTDANGDLKNLPKEMFTMVNKDILSQVNVSPIIQYFVMKYKNDNLRGLSILDTPGFSSNDAQDQTRTLDVINEAHALFWVVDANTGDINQTSLRIISENVQEVPLYIVINKADTKTSAEITELRKHIQGTMERAGINVADYVVFSKKEPLENLMRVIGSLPDGKSGLDIASICFDLKRDIFVMEELLKENKIELRELKKLLDNREEVINDDIAYMVENSERIASIPQYNSKWFGKDDYRMDISEYIELKNLCEGVKDVSDQVKECFDDYKEFIAEYHTGLNKQTDLKERNAATNNVYKLLLNAIKSLDSKLYQELEEKVSEELEKFKLQSKSTNIS